MEVPCAKWKKNIHIKVKLWIEEVLRLRRGSFRDFLNSGGSFLGSSSSCSGLVLCLSLVQWRANCGGKSRMILCARKIPMYLLKKCVYVKNEYVQEFISGCRPQLFSIANCESGFWWSVSLMYGVKNKKNYKDSYTKRLWMKNETVNLRQ